MSAKPYPCGKQGNIKLRERILHYKMCSHPECIQRLLAWEGIRSEAKKPGAITFSRK